MCRAVEDLCKESREEGQKLGEEKSSRRSAQRMLVDGILPLEKIAEYSGLPLNEVRRLAEEMGR